MIDKHGEILCHNRNVKRENKWAWQAVLSTSSQVSVGAKSIDQTKRDLVSKRGSCTGRSS